MVIKSVSVEKEIAQDFCFYAISTVNRAIPSVTDGLKISHRRILQTCFELDCNKLTKTAKIAGLVAGLHPHGDVGKVIQNLADVSSYLQPLLFLQGNGGGYSLCSRQKISGDNAAASRYTESSLSLLSQNLFDLVISSKPSYDSSKKEITSYSTSLPLSLLNPNYGIGTGYACNTIGFTAENVLKAIVNIENKEVAIKSLGFPDIPWNTNIVKTEAIIDLHETGKAAIQLQGEWFIDKELSTSFYKTIIITKLATGNVDQFLTQIKTGVESGKICGISKLSDETSKEIRVLIKCKKNTDPKEVINQLLQVTNLSSTFSVNSTFVCSETKLPKLFTPFDLLLEWYEARQLALITKFELEKVADMKTLKLKEGLLALLPQIKKIVSDILESETVEEAKIRLMSNYGIEEVLALAILDISLKQLTKLSESKLRTEVETLQVRLETLNLLLTNPQALHAEICRLASNCLKYCSHRISQVIEK